MNCNICGEEDSVDERCVAFDYCQCEDCGSYVKQSLPSEEDKESLRKQLANFLLSAARDPNKEKKRISVAQAQVDVLEKYVDKGVVYDLGAASGFFLKAAKDRGWQVEGNELSNPAITQAKQKYDIDLDYGFFEELQLEENKYQAVVMWNSLEHVFNPDEVIEKTHNILQDGGVVFIKVPAKSEKELARFYEKEHFYEFSMEGLVKLLTRKGFKIEESVVSGADDEIPYQNTATKSAVVVARK